MKQEDAERVLRRYHDAIFECFQTAFDKWQATVLPLMPSNLPRDFRNAMSGLIDEEVRTRLGSMDGVVVTDRGQRVLAFIKNKIVLNTKFFCDDRLSTRNNPTPTSRAYDRGAPLPGMEGFARVTAGYRLNPLETEISGVFLKARWRGGWRYEITRDGVSGVVLTLPIKERRRVHPKRQDEEREKVIQKSEDDE